MRNKIVLLNGKEWKSRIDLMHLAIMWECVRNNTVTHVVISAEDERGRYQYLDIRKIDPDKTFGSIIYDRSTPLPSIPPAA